jgi:hypothetical protein
MWQNMAPYLLGMGGVDKVWFMSLYSHNAWGLGSYAFTY